MSVWILIYNNFLVDFYYAKPKVNCKSIFKCGTKCSLPHKRVEFSAFTDTGHGITSLIHFESQYSKLIISENPNGKWKRSLIYLGMLRLLLVILSWHDFCDTFYITCQQKVRKVIMSKSTRPLSLVYLRRILYLVLLPIIIMAW